MLTLVLLLQLANAPQSPAPPLARMDQLQVWLTAVERHVPGTADDMTLRVRSWSRGDLDRLRLDLRSMLTLVRDPKANLFHYDPDPRRPARPPAVIVYSRAELSALRAMAGETARLGDGNRVLKRGAMLHTTIAMLDVLPAPEAPRTGARAPAGPQQFTLYLADGRPLGLEESVGHWEFARLLLDGVVPDSQSNRRDPAADPMVRLWYQATSAYMLGREQWFLPHFARAIALFPDDADILSFAGTLHETLASPRVQESLRSARRPPGFEIESERGELREAEALFRRAVAARGDYAEARVRLARVLIALERPGDALVQLDAVLPATADPVLQYFGAMFRGRAADATGDREAARRAFERAAALYPLAQSPRLALSELAARAGDRGVALAHVERTLEPVADADAVDDPWWVYYKAAGRNANALLDHVSALVPAGGP